MSILHRPRDNQQVVDALFDCLAPRSTAVVPEPFNGVAPIAEPIVTEVGYCALGLRTVSVFRIPVEDCFLEVSGLGRLLIKIADAGRESVCLGVEHEVMSSQVDNKPGDEFIDAPVLLIAAGTLGKTFRVACRNRPS